MTKTLSKYWPVAAAGAVALLAAAPALAQGAPAAAPAPFTPTADMVNKGDTAWMLVSSALVLMMSVPGLALFYGGLVRSKNMLSVLMQVIAIVCITTLMWVGWGYSMAFTGGGEFVGGLDKAFLKGVDATTFAATFSNKVYLPEYVYVIFQMTFACITPALIVGGLAERVRFWPLMLFIVLWSTIVYYPIAHMVWYWGGPDFTPANPNDHGFLFGKGALDFAGGTVVHINSGIAGLVGCLVLGKRLGYKHELMAPHSLPMTYIGACLLWVGWFGFNAGSNLEANGVTGVAFINTYVATAAAAMAWILVEQVVHKKPSLLGAVSGAVVGLVAITPASGYASPVTSIILGAVASLVCFLFVTKVKNKLGYDDALDVFGVHCVGGIVGALGTAFCANPAWGGQGIIDYSSAVAKAGTFDLSTQIVAQLWAIGVTLLWSGGVSFVLFFGIDKLVGLRPAADAEREGLDITEHGERAYNA
ncbi:ammonium transporter [Sphingomonas sp. ASV193]|uniref:ammonium transporter n=1 Tax=Sphingomonas sp. ASV193 TaxID=3144405 RepID=UPI0032E933AE